MTILDAWKEEAEKVKNLSYLEGIPLNTKLQLSIVTWLTRCAVRNPPLVKLEPGWAPYLYGIIDHYFDMEERDDK